MKKRTDTDPNDIDYGNNNDIELWSALEFALLAYDTPDLLSEGDNIVLPDAREKMRLVSKEGDTENAMTNEKTSLEENMGSTYFEKQKKEEIKEKILAAAFAVEAIDMLAKAKPSEIKPIGDESVLYLDGGSSSIPLWTDYIRPRIKSGELLHCWIYTNNCEIFHDYLFGKECRNLNWDNFTILGQEIDKDHACLNGSQLVRAIKDDNFRPTAFFIGTRGLQLSEDGKIHFACHGKTQELQTKQAYFEAANTSIRVILGSPKKTGLIDGRSFDITNIKDLASGPIVFITAEPLPATAEYKSFHRARSIFKSNKFRSYLQEKGITFIWFIIREQEGTENIPELKEVLSSDDQLQELLNRQLEDNSTVVSIANE